MLTLDSNSMFHISIISLRQVNFWKTLFSFFFFFFLFPVTSPDSLSLRALLTPDSDWVFSPSLSLSHDSKTEGEINFLTDNCRSISTHAHHVHFLGDDRQRCYVSSKCLDDTHNDNDDKGMAYKYK